MVDNFITVLIRTLFLFLFWFLLSGKTDPFYLTVGFLGAAVIAFLSRWKSQTPTYRLSQLPGLMIRGPIYLVWLFCRIILAAVHVSKIVLHPKLPISPRFIEHKTKLQGDDAKVAFGNSITLTPGTITADISGDIFIIHELDPSCSENIRSGKMEDAIDKVFNSS